MMHHFYENQRFFKHASFIECPRLLSNTHKQFLDDCFGNEKNMLSLILHTQRQFFLHSTVCQVLSVKMYYFLIKNSQKQKYILILKNQNSSPFIFDKQRNGVRENATNGKSGVFNLGVDGRPLWFPIEREHTFLKKFVCLGSDQFKCPFFKQYSFIKFPNTQNTHKLPMLIYASIVKAVPFGRQRPSGPPLPTRTATGYLILSVQQYSTSTLSQQTISEE